MIEPAIASPSPEPQSAQLPLPAAVDPWRFRWSVLLFILALHLLALTAVLPWLFSWLGLAMMFAGLFVFGTVGINLCYHRLLTHRSFRCPRWLERTLTLLALCNLQGSSVRWVAAHRQHHQHSDEQPDPHSPLVNFIWSHFGWLFTQNPDIDNANAVGRYAADLCREPFHLRLEQKQRWLWVVAAHILLFYACGHALGWVMSGNFSEGARLGLSLLVWGVCVRLVVVWHVTWAINSVTHLWGYRNYATSDNSRNNWLLGYFGMGEGWHNNHHADQRSAAHGHRWWEIDITYLTIRFLEIIGLATDVKRPTQRITDNRPVTAEDGIAK